MPRRSPSPMPELHWRWAAVEEIAEEISQAAHLPAVNSICGSRITFGNDVCSSRPAQGCHPPKDCQSERASTFPRPHNLAVRHWMAARSQP